MKLITDKQAKKISEDFSKRLKIVFTSHGVKPKEMIIKQFEKSMYKMLGGKKNEKKEKNNN